MAGRELRAEIVLAGRNDPSLKQLESWLSKTASDLGKFGAQMSLLSAPLVKFGKEAFTQFMGFDDMMLKIKSVGEMSAKELEAVEEAVRQAGMTTRYTATDAAEAALLLTQVGLGYQDVIDLMPEVLEMAQAGDLSVADAADYLHSTIKSMGLDISYADTLIDQMAKTASIGATDMDTLGESLTRLGSGVKLIKGGSSEALTILSAMSEFGEDMRGSSGGTQLRNFFMTLAAPVGSKADLIDMLGEMGSSIEEFEEVMDGVDLEGAGKAIADMGLQVYKDGELQNGIDIIKGLRNAVAGMSEEERNQTLGNIFGKRTMTTALNLIKLTDEEWNKLQADIENSEGFAAQMAETQESGIGGQVRRLKSMWEEFEIGMGSAIANRAEGVIDWLQELVGWLNSFDDDTKQRWVDIGAALAGIGPAALGLAGATKVVSAFVGALTNPTSALFLAGYALGFLYDQYQKAEDVRISGLFGDVEMDAAETAAYLATLRTEFTRTLDDLEQYNEQLGIARDAYETASRELSATLYSSLVTGAELSDSDKAKLMSLGDQMIDATLEGINARESKNNEYMKALFAGDEDEENLDNSLGISNDYFGQLRGEYEAVGADLRTALTEALKDGSIDEGDREAIMAQVRRLNEIQAEIIAAQNKVEYEKLLHKGQTVGLEGVRDFTQAVNRDRERQLAELRDEYETQRATKKVEYDAMIESAKTDEERVALTDERKQTLNGMDAAFQRQSDEFATQFYGPVATAWDKAFEDSELGGVYTRLQELARILETGGGAEGIGEWMDGLGEGDYSSLMTLVNLLEEASESLGGMDALSAISEFYETTGQTKPEWLDDMAEVVRAYEAALAAHDSGITRSSQYGYLDEADDIAQASGERLRGSATAGVEIHYTQSELDAARTEIESWSATVDVDANTAPAETNIDKLNDRDVRIVLIPNASAIESWLNTTRSMNVKMNPMGGLPTAPKLFAEGGRSDEPAIFGEAGAEWAIPERHDDRTADLLRQSAQASGFTWDELAERTGGLNASVGQRPMAISYAPVIHANDARGVDEVLRADKDRLKRMLAEIEMEEQVRAY